MKEPFKVGDRVKIYGSEIGHPPDQQICLGRKGEIIEIKNLSICRVKYIGAIGVDRFHIKQLRRIKPPKKRREIWVNMLVLNKRLSSANHNSKTEALEARIGDKIYQGDPIRFVEAK